MGTHDENPPTTRDFADPATLDDPIGPIPWRLAQDPPTAPSAAEHLAFVTAKALAVRGLAILLASLWVMDRGSEAIALVALIAVIGLLNRRIKRDLSRAPAIWAQARRRRAGPLSVTHGLSPRTRKGRDAAVIQIGLGPPQPAGGASFDPDDAADRAIARTLFRARVTGMSAPGAGRKTLHADPPCLAVLPMSQQR